MNEKKKKEREKETKMKRKRRGRKGREKEGKRDISSSGLFEREGLSVRGVGVYGAGPGPSLPCMSHGRRKTGTQADLHKCPPQLLTAVVPRPWCCCSRRSPFHVPIPLTAQHQVQHWSMDFLHQPTQHFLFNGTPVTILRILAPQLPSQTLLPVDAVRHMHVLTASAYLDEADGGLHLLLHTR